MGMIDRRKAGVTFLSVFRATKKLASDPEFEPSSHRNLARRILEEILQEALPTYEEENPGIDIDALIEFIEKILPIIMALLALF